MSSTKQLRAQLLAKLRVLEHGKSRRLVIIVLAFAIVGSIILMTSQAATPTTSIEAESGLNSANAQDLTGNGSSANGYVKFKAASGVNCTTGLLANVEACGWPGPSNTGVQPGHTLQRVDGNITIASDFIDKEVYGCVSINASNITIRNVRIHYPAATCFGWGSMGISDTEGSRQDFTGLVIDHVEIDGSADQIAPDDAIHFSSNVSYTVTNSNIHHVDDCISFQAPGGTVVFHNNYCHSVAVYPGAHSDGLEFYGGNNIQFYHNFIDTGSVSGTWNLNIKPFNAFSGVIEDNLLNGIHGGIIIDLGDGGPIGSLTIRNNKFPHTLITNCSYELRPIVSGNVYFDTGALVPGCN